MKELEKIVREENRAEFHRLIIAHGRQCCCARTPGCDGCCLKEICAFGVNCTTK